MCDCNCSSTVLTKEIVDFNDVSEKDFSYAESSVSYVIEKLYKSSTQNYVYDFIKKTMISLNTDLNY